ncbi:MAG: hypothetical protein QOJ63_1193 [Solirubrobacteraceae bacterium]|jgi:hypothetical protein|nr:hypothetical protein [Solirubrobacteraceae bacterium]
MAHSDARAWWADVQYLRDGYERTDEARRRANEADLASRGASRDHGRVEAEVSPAHRGHADPIAPAPPAHEGSFAPRRGHDMEQAAQPHSAPRVPGDGALGRRTIEIRGRTVPAPAVPRATDVERRRQQRRAIERVGPRPDRVAMWALLMGLLLILVAIGTADAPAVVALTLR